MIPVLRPRSVKLTIKKNRFGPGIPGILGTWHGSWSEMNSGSGESAKSGQRQAFTSGR
jgi:hypothetical protein